MECESVSLPIAALAAAFAAAPVQAQPVDLAGKTVTLIIGFGTGGGYDLWGRTVARHIAKHLPGKPTVVPQNMPGAGSLRGREHISTRPRRRTAPCSASSPATPALGPLSNAPGARFDATKLSWLGSPTRGAQRLHRQRARPR